MAKKSTSQRRAGRGLSIPRRFTRKGTDPLESVTYELRSSRITNPDGSVVFEMKDVEVPMTWSQVSTDVLAQKYFRKKGVPDAKGGRNGSEWSAKQVMRRLAGTWRHWGEQYGYFATKDDAHAFQGELEYMLIHQMAAPNSPQWFNTGLAWAYGIKGEAQGHYYIDPATGALKKSTDAYTRPQPHACFIQSVNDDLVNEGGIFDLMTREARLFKYGSGTGTNFSSIRGKAEKLSGGGRSSGLMSFLATIDRAAGAIKSGGTTRRAAKMVCLDMDHPEIEDFIDWKVVEEEKVASLTTGSHVCYDHLKGIVEKACAGGIDPEGNLELKVVIQRALRAHVPANYVKRILMRVEQGLTQDQFTFHRYETDFRSEAYLTVSGQNSNNSLRVPNSFMEAVFQDGEWQLKNRLDGKVAKTMPARTLWNKLTYAAWACADPGVQFDTTINEWHTCPEDGRIQASNPCVAGDTLVSTTEGYRRIQDLVGKEVTIVDPVGRSQKVQRVFRTGYKPVFELKTKSGYSLRVTEDHLIYTIERGYVPAAHLQQGDTLVLGSVGFGHENLPEQFAEALGLAVGDGCVTQDDQETFFLTLGKMEEPIAHRVNDFLNTYKTEHALDGRSARQTAVCKTPTTVRVGTASRVIVDMMKRYAVLNKGSLQKQLTDAAFDLDRAAQTALLRGLFTADGTVAHYGEKSQYVSLDSSSKILLQQVQLLLLGFGIKAKLYEDRRHGVLTNVLPDGKGGLKQYAVSEMHSLRISRSSRQRFADAIGFLAGTEKAQKLATLNETVTMYRDRMHDSFASLQPIGTETVYDLTEPNTNAFIANGLWIHNCSEYMFLDDTACNLASLNLIKFYDAETRTLDIEAYKHAIRLWTVVLEISVLMAQFPSKEIAQRSYDFRTLGLGYANLATVLMQMGIPYASEEGYAICGAITAILCGESYATSAEMARFFGPFSHYTKNKEHMLRVIRNHRRAAYYAAKKEYEGLTVAPHGIQEEYCPKELLQAAREAWDTALSRGEKWGYRNAQVTVIAPTGTIGLVMGCDTTGIEPDFALVKFKKLVGGGYFKIINASLEIALSSLGYDGAQMKEIIDYVKGHGTLTGCPNINERTLRAKGFTEKELLAIEAQLLGVFDLRFAFNRWVLGDDFCTKVLGLSEEQLNNPRFDLLKTIGFTDAQIEAANEYVCGTMTIEGAPHLQEQHLPIFDCANRCGKKGRRFIPWIAHLRMMAAAQPFISGSISKTINMPEETTLSDVAEAYKISWDYMLKCVALYRDGSKLSQPLNTQALDSTYASLFSGAAADDADETQGAREASAAIAREVARPIRHKLPPERHSITHKFAIDRHEGYLTIGLYDDGAPGELFIKMSKEGSTLSGIMDALATTVSLCLQYGVPLEVLVSKFCHSRFEPAGMTGNKYIPLVKSIMDYIGRYLAMKFLPREVAKKYHHAELIDRAYTEGDVKLLKRVPVEPPLELTEVEDAPKVAAKTMVHAQVAVHGKEQLQKLQTNAVLGLNNEDAPMCTTCGLVMVRNGACYKCLDCGETSGCS